MSSASTFPTVGSVTKNPNIDPKPPVLVLVKDGPLKGRQVTLIPLDNPAALDPEIEKNKSIINREFTKESLRQIAATIVAIVLIALCIAGLIFGSGIIIPLALGVGFGIALLWGISTMLIATKSSVERQGPRHANRELEECKQNMVKNEFKAFTRDFSNVLPLDQLLKTNHLFKRAVSINFSELEFQQRKDVLATDLKNLREEIQALQV